MNSNKLAGPVRELITAAGGLMVALNLAPETMADQIGGGVMAAVMIILGVTSNVGSQQLLTLVRKFLSLVPAILVSTGVLSESAAASVAAIAMPLLSMIWSYAWKDTLPAASNGFVGLVLALLIISLPSCESLKGFGNSVNGFVKSPSGRVVIFTGGSLLVSQLLDKQPSVEPVLIAFSNSLDGIPTDFTNFEDPEIAAVAVLLGSLTDHYGDDVTNELLADTIRAGLAVGPVSEGSK